MTAPWLPWLTKAGRDLERGLLHLVYPGHCLTCGRPLHTDAERFCGDCRVVLFHDPQKCCPRCAATVGPHGVADGRCPQCRDQSFAFEAALRLGPYDGLLRRVILRLKSQRGEGLAEWIGSCWAEQAAESFRALRADTVLPVPLHFWRRMRRGYNQSLAVAHGSSRKTPSGRLTRASGRRWMTPRANAHRCRRPGSAQP